MSAAVTASFPEPRRGGWLRPSAAGCCTGARPDRAGSCAAGAPRLGGSPRSPRAYSCRQPPKSAAALSCEAHQVQLDNACKFRLPDAVHHSIARMLTPTPARVRQSKAGRGAPGEEP